MFRKREHCAWHKEGRNENFWVSLGKVARLSGLWLHPRFCQEGQQKVGGGHSGRGGGGRARG